MFPKILIDTESINVLVSLLSPRVPAAVLIAVVRVLRFSNSLGEKGPIILYDVAMLAT